MKRILLIYLFIFSSYNFCLNIMNDKEKQVYEKEGADGRIVGLPLLFKAIQRNSYPLAEFLILSGADPNLKRLTQNAFTTLWLQMFRRVNRISEPEAIEFTKLLLDNGAKPELIFVTGFEHWEVSYRRSITQFKDLMKYIFTHPKVIEFLESQEGKKILDEKDLVRKSFEDIKNEELKALNIKKLEL